MEKWKSYAKRSFLLPLFGLLFPGVVKAQVGQMQVMYGPRYPTDPARSLSVTYSVFASFSQWAKQNLTIAVVIVIGVAIALIAALRFMSQKLKRHK